MLLFESEFPVRVFNSSIQPRHSSQSSNSKASIRASEVRSPETSNLPEAWQVLPAQEISRMAIEVEAETASPTI
jgi:alpha-amylase/alpha-mannosidase (GH57 family)